MFSLIELLIGCYEIVKSEEKNDEMPHTVHGFIFITDEADKYLAYLVTPSQELNQSGEIDKLLDEALALTEEAVDDEFGD